MSKLMNQSASLVAQTISNFGFSAARIEELGASEFTLVNIAIDLSPSTGGYIDDLKKALGNTIEALAKSPNAEKLLVRVETFNEELTEIHGFVPTTESKPGDYDITCGGRGTALLDAILSGIESCAEYGRKLDEKDYSANAVTFIITDGMENSSQKARSPQKIVDGIEKVRMDENLESIKTILVGVGNESAVKDYLENLKAEAKLDQYVWIGEATPGKLAKLADFVSKSVSSASQALGTGGPSQNLSF